MLGFLKPLPEKPLLPEDKIDPTYRRLRWQVFMEFSLVMPLIILCAVILTQKG